MFGKGLFHGSLTNLAYVPSQQTDFIFSAVGEQLGFVGGGVLLLLYGVVAWRVLRTAQQAKDTFGRMLCAGSFALIVFSVFENVGMNMGIMPVAGIPLPFLSYGGSAMICLLRRRRHHGQRARPERAVTDATAGPREVPPAEPQPALEADPEPQQAHDGVTDAGPGRCDDRRPLPMEPFPKNPVRTPAPRRRATSGWRWSPRSPWSCPTSTRRVVLRESESPRRQLTFSIALPDAVVLSHALRRISDPPSAHPRAVE